MKQISRVIRQGSVDDFKIEGDRNLFDRIVSDMVRFSGQLYPSKAWDFSIGKTQSLQGRPNAPDEKEGCVETKYDRYFSSMQKMMDPWVGCTGMQNISDEIVAEYYSFIQAIDRLNILSTYFDSSANMINNANDLMITDLGTIIDVNLISSLLKPSSGRCKIVEVGGGYGRLAEAFFSIFGKEQVCYVLIDAVPVSIMYAYIYIKKMFPGLKVGFFYNNDPMDLDLFDCYIAPAWHFEVNQSANNFDCAVNIQSMQEMDQYHVDYYLDMFDKIVSNNNGVIYISNERDYLFQGQWNFPPSWQCIFKSRTPRSWTRDSPTEIYIKSEHPVPCYPKMLNIMYQMQLEYYDRCKK